MALYMIGLGLCNAKDISVQGLEIVRKCSKVYLENYTSLLQCSVTELEEFYGCSVIVSDRASSEQGMEEIVSLAESSDVAFLVIGDPSCATTHFELYRLAKEKGVTVSMIHNASVFTAIGSVGLQVYKYGKTCSIPYLSRVPNLETPYHVIRGNLSIGAHTLCLLDIMVDNVDAETGGKGVANGSDEASDDDSSNTKFMTVAEALGVLLDIEKRLGLGVIKDDTLVVGVARLGCMDQVIKVATVSEMLKFDDSVFAGPLHSLIIPGKMHFLEEENLEMWV